MDLTEERVVYYTGALYMVGLRRDGSGLVVIDTAAEVTPLADEQLLARLSRKTKVVVFEVNEAIDLYMTGCWATSPLGSLVTCWPESRIQAPPTPLLLGGGSLRILVLADRRRRLVSFAKAFAKAWGV